MLVVLEGPSFALDGFLSGLAILGLSLFYRLLSIEIGYDAVSLLSNSDPLGSPCSGLRRICGMAFSDVYPRDAQRDYSKQAMLYESAYSNFGTIACLMLVASEDYPPSRKPPRIASSNASRPRLVASIPIKSTRKKNSTIPPATYVKIKCGRPEVSATPMNGPARTARMSKRQPQQRSLDHGRLGCRLARSRG